MYASNQFCGFLRSIGAACALCIALSFTAFASVLVIEGNEPEPDQENVLLMKSLDGGQLITGRTNQTNRLVDFTTTSGYLVFAGSKGQS